MDPQNASTRAFTGDRSPARAAVDNVMRRSLKISNPYDPAEVAKGLLARYRDATGPAGFFGRCLPKRSAPTALVFFLLSSCRIFTRPVVAFPIRLSISEATRAGCSNDRSEADFTTRRGLQWEATVSSQRSG